MRKFSRRSSAIVLAGVLAFAGAACGDDEPEADIDVTEPAGGDTTIEETTTEDMGSTETDTEMDMGTEGDTEMDMGTETE